jgi:peptide deformylase
MLKIVQAPNPVLAQKAKPIAKVDTAVHKLIKQMILTLEHAKDPEGVGLAAPQVGKSLQLFIVKMTPRSPILTFINPKIESFFDEPKGKAASADGSGEPKEDKDVQLEGCLSLHSIWGVVKRRYGVVLSYMDEDGKEHQKKFDGFMSVIIQHEYDHLQGVLFPKRVLEQENPLYKSVKNKKGEVEFEEIEL